MFSFLSAFELGMAGKRVKVGRFWAFPFPCIINGGMRMVDMVASSVHCLLALAIEGIKCVYSTIVFCSYCG